MACVTVMVIALVLVLLQLCLAVAVPVYCTPLLRQLLSKAILLA